MICKKHSSNKDLMELHFGCGEIMKGKKKSLDQLVGHAM